MHNYVDNFFGFRTFARRVEDCFSSRRIDSGDRFRHFFRLARPNPQNRSSESILSFHGFFACSPSKLPSVVCADRSPSQRGAMRNLMSRIRCLDVSTRIRLSNQKRHFSESQSKKCRFSSLRSVVSVGVALLEANRELHNVVIAVSYTHLRAHET